MGKRNCHIALRVAVIHFSGSYRHFQFGMPIGKNGMGYVRTDHIRMRGF